MITKIYKIFCAGLVGCGFAATLTSCEDFFNQESDDVLYAEDEHLNNAVDTIYSVNGILTKLQALADRTILFGELRGDLVDLTEYADSNLQAIANFDVDDNNKYNQPSDYYAVINNCNYFLAHADTAMKSNRNEDIFMKEYCAVKGIRAWTYLQLGLVYGNVPFYTEPLLSKEAAEVAESSKADLLDICSYFINDLQGLPERYNVEFPTYKKITNSRLLFFPLSIVRGDLYLWRAALTRNVADYKEAAKHYYTYINQRNGENSAYATGREDYCMWQAGATSWDKPNGRIFPIAEAVDPEAEMITMIPTDSLPQEGNYSELRKFFTSDKDMNEYLVSIVPSERIKEISEAQANCVLTNDGSSMFYAPKELTEYRSGDLRLQDAYRTSYYNDPTTGYRIETQTIQKYSSSNRNVHIYRRTMVYLRLAEALNGAGYPHMAYQILAQGLSNEVIDTKVIPHYPTASDFNFLVQFDFNDARYEVCDAFDFARTNVTNADHNMIGIHARGSGFTPMDTTYVLPHDTIEYNATKRAQLIKEQQAYVDSLLLNESALEFAFEGTRYYDIMRYALRQQNPEATMRKIIGARKGIDNPTDVKLSGRSSWFLTWKGKLGY